MPDIRFQSSINDSFGAPGVYVKTIAPSAPVRGIFLGTTGFIGECVRGPVNKLIRCDSYQRFVDVFGERDYGINGGTLRGQVWWALQQKTVGKFYVIRAAAAAATTASFDFETAAGGAGTPVLHVAARSPGAHGNDIQITITAASNGDSNSFNLTTKLYKNVQTFQNLNISGTNDNLLATVGSDDATWIVLTKLAAGRPVNSAPSTDGADTNGYVKLGQTVSGFTSVVGSDGTIADSDFTAAGGPMEKLNSPRGIDVKLVAGRSNSAIKTKIFGLAPTSYLSWWVICPDDETVSDTAWETEIANYRHKAIFPTYNHPYYIDPITTVKTRGEPHVQMAADLSQIEPDVHPGVDETSALHQQIVDLAFDLTQAQKDALDAAGSSFMTRDVDVNNNNVIMWGNGRTADLTNNNSQIDGERSKAFLITGLANRMRGDQNRPNTPIARAKRKGAFEGWLTELAKLERFVDRDDNRIPQFQVLNGDDVNTPSDRKKGIQRDLVRIALIPKNLFLQLQIEAGTDVVITEV